MIYWFRPRYTKTLMQPRNWNEEEFLADYAEMVGVFRSLPGPPELFVMVPPPLYFGDKPGNPFPDPGW